MEFLIVLVVLALVVLFVSAPLRRVATQDPPPRGTEIAELEAARDAKYREIRDAELDYRMGKLDEADWREADRELRGQAIEILRELDALDGG